MQMETSTCKLNRKLSFDEKLFIIHYYCFLCLITASFGDVYIPPFQIIVCLPAEIAPHTSRELRRVLAKWESEDRIVYRDASPHSYAPADIPMFVTPLPIGNDGYAMIPTLCDALEIHNPSIVLSLLESQKSLFSRVISANSWIPVLSLTQQYKENPTTIQVMTDD